MKAIISTDYSDTYLYFLPINTWCLNKLGIDVVCLMPSTGSQKSIIKLNLVTDFMFGKEEGAFLFFDCPERKEATYVQISRLFGCATDMIDDSEAVLIGDVDMLLFRKDFIEKPAYDFFDIYGDDLTPKGQLPMCYAVASAATWRKYFVKGRTLQQCLDDELAHEECENMRGNLWSRDQELLAKGVGDLFLGHSRTNGQNQFAMNRVDRTDLHYKDRLNHDVIDAHLWRDGYTDDNHAKIMELLQFMYPSDSFEWLDEYRIKYLSIIK